MKQTLCKFALWVSVVLAALLSPSVSTATTQDTSENVTVFGAEACSQQGGTWDTEQENCNFGTKNPSSGKWECIDGAKWDESQQRCVPTGSWNPEKEYALCVMRGHTWDPSKPKGQQCIDSNGAIVDVYCDEGVKDSIESAMRTQMEFGALQPHIDEIFDRSAECFKGATTIYDLSPAIPTLWSFISDIIESMKGYIEQPVCNVAYSIKDKIKAANSEVIDTINKLSSADEIIIANLSSTLFTNDDDSNLMDSITFAGSPKDQSGQTFTINPNGLNLQQRVFNPPKCDAKKMLSLAGKETGELYEAEQNLERLQEEVKIATRKLEACDNRYDSYLANTMPGTPVTSREDFCKNEIAAVDRLSAEADAATAAIDNLEDGINQADCNPDSTWSNRDINYGQDKPINRCPNDTDAVQLDGTPCSPTEIKMGTCPCPSTGKKCPGVDVFYDGSPCSETEISNGTCPCPSVLCNVLTCMQHGCGHPQCNCPHLCPPVAPDTDNSVSAPPDVPQKKSAATGKPSLLDSLGNLLLGGK
ncbi:MAG: hypothetical protein IKZ87_04260 [Actinomycetaceae bacterium]|nr:hypothetical protein [Actinomycetaceae bacterium]